jgi:2,3-bisphosphoglycerate-independent phosphoglycerate mutase
MHEVHTRARRVLEPCFSGHGWQGLPALLASPYCGADPVSRFTERDCVGGSLGVMPAQDLMPLVMANALRFTKYGA